MRTELANKVVSVETEKKAFIERENVLWLW